MTEIALPSVAGLNVSRETFAKLQAFEALVRKWTPAINLVSKNTLPNLWERHIVDSAQIFAFRTLSARSWADFGAGGGFPGLVVALVAQDTTPDLHVTLIESDLRKATFLRQAARALNVEVTVLSERAESLYPLNADIVSARAVAPLSDLLFLAQRHLQAEGVAIFPKGARVLEEVADARKLWVFDVDSRPSLSEADASILVIRNIHRATD